MSKVLTKKNYMKKLILFAITYIISNTTIAQKKSILIGGNFEINSQKNNLQNNLQIGGPIQTSKQSNFSFSPTIGYQINNNFTVGITTSLKTIKFNVIQTYPSPFPNKQEITQKYTETNFGAFVRYSKTLSNTFTIYGQFETLFGNFKDYTKQEFTSGGVQNIQEDTVKGTSTNINLFPAIFINVKNNFGLNLNFGGVSYSENKAKDFLGSSSNFNFNLGKVINIGISKNFSTSSNRKKKK